MRDQFIVSKENNLLQILKELKEINRPIKYSELRRVSNLNGGTRTNVVCDLINLQLIDNNPYGFEISEKGLIFLNSDNSSVRKETYLQLPLFKEMHSNKLTNYKEIKHFVMNRLTLRYNNKDTLTRYTSSISGRYIEFILCKMVERDSEKKEKPNSSVQTNIISEIETIPQKQFVMQNNETNRYSLFGRMSQFLTIEEQASVIDRLPKKMRLEVIKFILKEKEELCKKVQGCL